MNHKVMVFIYIALIELCLLARIACNLRGTCKGEPLEILQE